MRPARRQPGADAGPDAEAVPWAEALLLHGYTGTPFEVATLAHAFAEAGMACHAPLLPGHGVDPAALNQVTRHDWLAAARTALTLRIQRAQGRPVFVVGCSMGGLLALHLAADGVLGRHITGMVLLAPALRFFPGAFAAVVGLGLGAWQLRPFLPKEAPGGDVGAADAQRKNPTYKVLPTRGLVELLALQWETERLLARVRTPLCIWHGEQDTTIDPISSEITARRVQHAPVVHHRLRDTRHLVALDSQRDLVCAESLAFCARLVARDAA